MSYEYKFESGQGEVFPLAGFLFVHKWVIDTNRLAIPVLGPDKFGYFFGVVSGTSDQSYGLTAGRFGNHGIGTLTSTERASRADFGKLSYVRGSYGQYANERGPGVLMFTFQSLELVGWVEPQHEAWVGDQEKTKNAATNLKNTFRHGAPEAVAEPIYSPRFFDDGNGLHAASVTRGFLNSNLLDLTRAKAKPANWDILGESVTPRVGMAGFHLVAQGCFKAAGWWHYPKIASLVGIGDDSPDLDKLSMFAYELVGPYGTLPRDLENCDRHQADNVIISDDPPVEVLYWQV